MRSKAPLALMEQLVMVLVFALAAALCVQVFVLSDRTSRQSEARDRAVLEAQTAAEVLKSCGGDHAEAARKLGGTWNGQMWGFRAGDCDVLVVPEEGGVPLLGAATVTVWSAEGDLLFSLPVAWQEVSGHA